MDTVGYVTLQEADNYIASRYVSDDSLRESWEDLDDTDKKVYLLKAFDFIEALPFTGRTTTLNQATAFPRYPATEIPECVKAAQIEQALNFSDNTTTEADKAYIDMRRHGITSYTIGNLSESLGSTSLTASELSSKSSILLQPYLTGGYCIGKNH